MTANENGATNLVIDFISGILQVDVLLEDAVVLVELDAFCPIIEGASDVNFFSGLLPDC